MYRIMLVGGHAISRESLRALIERERDLGIIAECGSLFEMEAALDAFEPDLLVLELSPPGDGTLSRLPELCIAHPDLCVIVLGSHEREPCLSEALARGADGYVSREFAGDELVAAIRAVLAGNVYLSSDLVSRK